MLYRLREPIDAAEAAERFTPIEDRGDRVLVADDSPYWNGKIRPTAVYLKSDLVVAEN